MIKSIAFTMYPVTDIARARKFYEQDLGFTVSRVFQDAGSSTIWQEVLSRSRRLRKALVPAPTPAAGSASKSITWTAW